MGKHKKKVRFNIWKLLRTIIVLLIFAAVVIFAVRTVKNVIGGQAVGDALAAALPEKIAAIIGNRDSEDNENEIDLDSEITDSQEIQPVEEPAWPNTTTTEDMYPLSSPDDDILVLVNKTHPMTEEYVANDFVTVEHCDPDVGNKETRQMRKVAADAFEELYAGAQEAGYNILMRTGYRSYSYQTTLYNSYVSKNGEEKANTYSAKPGQSEHQTGLCCDVGRPGKGLTSFDGTDEAKWVAENCWKYGFIVRFPEGKTDITGYIYESWHIRYVGKEAAQIIYDNNWTLEEYLQAAAENSGK